MNKILSTLLLITLTYVALAASTAQASYVRIWRGHMATDISNEQFRDGLNHSLLPATGDLAHTSANLQSYLPVVLSEELRAAGLPAEIAMLTYSSEQDYAVYRSTPEGKHYGDLHWRLFERDKSFSLIAKPFQGEVEIENAYAVVEGDPTWQASPATFRVIARRGGLSDAEFLSGVQGRIAQVVAKQPDSYFVLVAADYILEYVSGESLIKNEGLATIPLVKSRVLNFGTGVRYPMVDTADAGTRKVWQRHIQAWNERDLDGIMADYHAGSVVIRNDEVYTGLTEIRAFFAKMFRQFDRAESASIDRIIANKNVVYIHWQAETKTEDGTAIQSSGQGTDTFVISKNRIDVQTVTAKQEFWD